MGFLIVAITAGLFLILIIGSIAHAITKEKKE